MRILVIGSGAREHALLWKLRQSARVSRLFVSPGNAGMEGIATCLPLDGDGDAVTRLGDLAEANQIDLTVVGPENFLVDGLVDHFLSRGLRIFGPTSAAARLEGSKLWAKGVMQRVGIPTASWRVFFDKGEARAHAEAMAWSCVIKADGLASGKGSFVCRSVDDVDAALGVLVGEHKFGDAPILIEELLDGQEVSVFAISDGHTVVPFGAAQDHKRAHDNDEGPNTGGMGAYTPVNHMQVAQDFAETFFAPVVNDLAALGIPYVGVLYAGAIVTEQGPKILEFNCRFGDPEAEVLLSRLDDDLAALLWAATEGELHTHPVLEWKPSEAVCVVIATDTYPHESGFGAVITGVEAAASGSEVLVFHAGTARDETTDQLVTAGGRILCVTALGRTLVDARRKAYEAVEKIHFDGMFFRKDIASKATGTAWQAFRTEWRKPPKWEQHVAEVSKEISEIASRVALLQLADPEHAADLQHLRDRLYEIRLSLRPSLGGDGFGSATVDVVPTDALDLLRGRFDEMLDEMNKPGARSAMDRAFRAHPEEFNRLVVEPGHGQRGR